DFEMGVSCRYGKGLGCDRNRGGMVPGRLCGKVKANGWLDQFLPSGSSQMHLQNEVTPDGERPRPVIMTWRWTAARGPAQKIARGRFCWRIHTGKPWFRIGIIEYPTAPGGIKLHANVVYCRVAWMKFNGTHEAIGRHS